VRDSYTATQSAVAQPFSRPVLDWGTPIPIANVGDRALAPDTSMLVLTGDPLAAQIYEAKNAARATSTYQWVFGRAAGTNQASFGFERGDSFEPDVMGAVNTAGVQWHDNFLWARKLKGKNYVWVDAGNVASANSVLTIANGANPIAATDLVSLTFFRFNQGDEQRVATILLPATAGGAVAATLQVPARDYYRFTITCLQQSTTATPFALAINQTWSTATFIHKALPGIDQRSDSITRLRILGAALRLMNVASEQYIAGSVVADQVEPSTCWSTYATAGVDPFALIASQRGQDIRDFKKGIYGFLKPVEEDDFQYLDIFRFDNTGAVTHRGDYNSDERPYVIMVPRSGGVADGFDPSRSTQVFYNFSVEYETKDIWTSVESSFMLPEETSKAVQVIASMEQFYENPVHWDKILRTIGSLARLAAPILSAIPHPYAKAGATVAGAIGSVL